MNGLQTSLKIGGGISGGYEIGGAVANIVNNEAAVNVAIQPDVKMLIVAACIPVVAIAVHWLMRIDWDHDGKPDLAAAEPNPTATPKEEKQHA